MDSTDRFRSLVTGPADALRLDEAAFAIAAHANEDLSIDEQIQRLDDLAAAVESPTLDALIGHLFGELGFAGAQQSYYDPRNSLLDRVLDRRIGIPITLAVVVIEVGRRLGLELDGVGMPAHFLVRRRTDAGDVFIDGFAGGRQLDRAGCRDLFTELTSGDSPFEDAFLDPIDDRLILIRMLNNLKAVHRARRDTGSLEWVLRLRVEFPELAQERAELAALIGSRGRFAEAASMLDDLADMTPSVDLVGADANPEQLRSQADGHRRAADRFRARLN